MADSPIVTPGPSPSPEPAPHQRTMAELLPEKPTAGADGMVTMGHLHVESALYDKFREAMIRDAKNPDTTTLVERLEKGPLDTKVARGADPGSSTTPELHGGSTVHWNPDYMLVDGQGGRHSSAVILGHELNHADHNNTDDFKYDRDRHTKGDPPFTNREDQNVVQGWENKTSRLLGEGVRHDNDSGHFVPSRGVTSLEPILHQTRNGQTSEVRSGYSQTGKIVEVSERGVAQQIRAGENVTYPHNELAAVTYPGALRVGETLNVSMHGREIAAREIPSHGPNDIGQAR